MPRKGPVGDSAAAPRPPMRGARRLPAGLALCAILGGAGCAARSRGETARRCEPLVDPLRVARGEIVIRCEPSQGSWLDCQVTTVVGHKTVKSGRFVLAGSREAPGFDTRDPAAYESWDGCSIRLTDGRTLEEWNSGP